MKPRRTIFLRPFTAADYLTSLSILSGWSAILLLLAGIRHMAVVVNALAILLDVLDGIVARKKGGGSEFGARLDAFSDVLNYLLFPSTLYFLAARSGRLWIGMGAALVVLFGVIRLAQLQDVQRESGEDPSVLIGLTVIHAYFAVMILYWAELLGASSLAWLFLLLAPVISILMVSSMRVKKSTANYLLLLALLAGNVALSLWRMAN